MAKQDNGKKEIQMNLAEAIDLFPMSKSKAFRIANRGNALYFMVDSKARPLNNKNFKTTFRAYKFYPNQGITITTAALQEKDEIIPITMKDFGDAVKERIDAIRTDPNEILQQELDYYEELGFRVN